MMVPRSVDDVSRRGGGSAFAFFFVSRNSMNLCISSCRKQKLFAHNDT